MVLCTRLAIERAGTETPDLQRGAPDFYPNKTNFDLNRRASPRPYLGEAGGEIPSAYSPKVTPTSVPTKAQGSRSFTRYVRARPGGELSSTNRPWTRPPLTDSRRIELTLGLTHLFRP
jgi:hypothetical protein